MSEIINDTNGVIDTDSILKSVDRDSNTRVFTGVYKKVITTLLIGVSVYMLLLQLLFTSVTPHTSLTTFVGLVLLMGFLIYPAYKKQVEKVNYIPWYDFVLAFLGSGSCFFYTINQSNVINNLNSSSLPTLYIVVAIIAILCLFELCRRAVGLPIIFVAGFFIVYLLYYYFQNPRLSANRVVSQAVYNLFYNLRDGVFGTPISVCVAFIVLFIIMGALLEKSGMANFFVDLANSVAGSTAGGPAKVAVISSSLEGMISGSSVANTVGSGSVTIPMMKKAGYRPEFAAAVEAAASTGGQIMPPIMGAAAFLMAEIAGESYGVIAIAAILPALLYFTGIFFMVHFEAKKNGLSGLPKDALPNFFKLFFQKGFLLAPIVVLVVCMNILSIGWACCTAIMTALILSLLPADASFLDLRFLFTKKCVKVLRVLLAPAIPTAIFFSILAIFGKNKLNVAILAGIMIAVILSFVFKNTNMDGKKLVAAFETGSKSSLSVAVACALAGMIAAVVTATSLASTITPFIRSLAQIHPFFALFATMICCIILGMGVPTTANYVIMGSTIAPILINNLGIPVLAAHMFVFYFGIVADITPPVALAAYAGSAIAKSNPMKTGITATKLAIAAFIVPYVFTLDANATLLVGYTNASVPSIILAVITSLVGMCAISMGLEGYAFDRLQWFIRVPMVISGLLLIYPGLVTDIIGFAAIAVLLLLSHFVFAEHKKAKE